MIPLSTVRNAIRAQRRQPIGPAISPRFEFQAMPTPDSEPAPVQDLIISCSLDRDHRGLFVAPELTHQSNRPESKSAEPAVINVPGPFLAKGNYFDVYDIAMQFPIERIAVVTHDDCGVGRALFEKIHNRNSPVHRFDRKTAAIIRDWEKLRAQASWLNPSANEGVRGLEEFTADELAKAVGELTSIKIAQFLASQTRDLGFEGTTSTGVTQNLDPSNTFNDIQIGAFHTIGRLARPQRVMAFTKIGSLAASFPITPSLDRGIR